MSLHSKIGASSMYRWSQCPASVRLSEGLEQIESQAATDGTFAHGVAASILEHSVYPDDVDPEVIEACMVYVDTVKSDAGPNHIQVEVRFDLSSLYPGLFGTADAVVYDPISKILRVYDYKHGSGILVEVSSGGTGNPQLMYYGLGALLSTSHPCSEVELVIVQPRANHPDGAVRRFRFKSFDLVEFAADLIDYAKKTADPNAYLRSGDWCRFCPAAGICPELGTKALSIAQTEFKPALSYDPQALSETLKKLDMLEGYAKSVRAFAYSEAEHGRCPPGWKLVQKRATRKWNDKASVTNLSEKFKIITINLFESPALKSPAQVEKLLSKDQKKQLSEFTVSVSSGLTLAEESDPRPSALKLPELEFTKIENDEELFN